MAAVAHVFRWTDSIVSSSADSGATQRPFSERPVAVPQKGAAANALLRVYRGIGGCWYVRREGAAPEGVFKARLAVIEFARLLGMGAGSYRILFETSNGSLLEERFIPCRFVQSARPRRALRRR